MAARGPSVAHRGVDITHMLFINYYYYRRMRQLSRVFYMHISLMHRPIASSHILYGLFATRVICVVLLVVRVVVFLRTKVQPQRARIVDDIDVLVAVAAFDETSQFSDILA